MNTQRLTRFVSTFLFLSREDVKISDFVERRVVSIRIRPSLDSVGNHHRDTAKALSILSATQKLELFDTVISSLLPAEHHHWLDRPFEILEITLKK